MICWLAYRRLLRLSLAELTSPAGGALGRHLASCPNCDYARGLWRQLQADLRRGAEFRPSRGFWDTFPMISSDGSEKMPTAGASGWLRRLDWWLAPERTLRWGVGAVAAAIMVVAGFSALPEQTKADEGFPNNLIISRGLVLVKQSHRKGLRLMPGAVSFSPTASIRAGGSTLSSAGTERS